MFQIITLKQNEKKIQERFLKEKKLKQLETLT